MARLWMLLSAVSLSVIMLLWPQTGSGAPKSCADNMNDIYKRVESLVMLDALDVIINKGKAPSGRGKAQEYIDDSLPAFKAACPGEAKSIKDLENGNYLKKLAAEREKRKKAHRHIKSSGLEISDSELFEGLEVQR